MNSRVKGIILLYIVTALVLFLVSGLLGLLMRFSQAELVSLTPTLFYRFMTLHGLGMVVTAVVAAMAMAWYLLSKLPDIRLGASSLLLIYSVLLVGVVGVILATLWGGVATGWTMLLPLPLPGFNAGQWGTLAAEIFLDSTILVGMALLLFFIMVLWKVVRFAGSFPRALGWNLLRGKGSGEAVPVAILPLAVASVAGLLATLAGVVYLVLMHLELSFPNAIFIDRLMAKNLVYLFGHTVVNITIYYAAAAIYVILPAYTQRPWRSSWLLAGAWNTALLFVLLAFFHHLYMDFVQPGPLQVVGQVASYLVALPPAVVTIFGALGYMWRSGVAWKPAVSFIFVGLFGWALGGAGAGLDATIGFNLRLHNTLWVPAHFHTYLLLGVVFFFFAFIYHTIAELRGRGEISLRIGNWQLALMTIGGLGQVSMWYLSGLAGAPRRYAVLPPGVEGYSLVASLGIAMVAIGFLVFVWGFLAALLRRP